VITRTVRVGSMEEIHVTMQRLPAEFMPMALDSLETVLRSQPRTMVLKRTPLATKARYDFYIRKDGKATRTGHSSGTAGALRNAVKNEPIRRVNGTTLTFGAHAEGVLDYAGYVHEAIKPREGEYWKAGMPGRGKGWTTHDTGNKFVTRAVEHYADWIPEKTTNELDRRLSEAGL